MSDKSLLQARKEYVEDELQTIESRLAGLRSDLKKAEAGLPSVQIQGEIDVATQGIKELQLEAKGASAERLVKISKEIAALKRAQTDGEMLLGIMRLKQPIGDETKDAILSEEINLQQKIAKLKIGIDGLEKQYEVLKDDFSYLRSAESNNEAQITEDGGKYKPPTIK